MPRGADIFDRGEGFRTFLWYPGADQVGEHTVTFVAADAQDQSIQTRVDVTINVLPGTFTSPAFTIVAPVAAEAIVGHTLSVIVMVTDSDGTVPELTSNNLPVGASFNDNGNGSRTFSWSPTAADIGKHRIYFWRTS